MSPNGEDFISYHGVLYHDLIKNGVDEKVHFCAVTPTACETVHAYPWQTLFEWQQTVPYYENIN